MKPILLVADDESDSADPLGQLLELYFPETTVRVAHGGSAALDSAQHQSPDVVILDLEMPELGGEELAGLLRQTRRERPMLLIALSGHISKLAELESKGLFDHRMSKPVDTQKLSRVIQTHLSSLGSVDDGT